MSQNYLLRLFISILALNFPILEVADAASTTVKCEVRVRAIARSKINIKLTGLSGSYYGLAYSPGSIGVTTKPKTAVASQVEFEFDSDPYEIATGSTKIPANFIKNRLVYGWVRRTSDKLLVGGMKNDACVLK